MVSQIVEDIRRHRYGPAARLRLGYLHDPLPSHSFCFGDRNSEDAPLDINISTAQPK